MVKSRKKTSFRQINFKIPFFYFKNLYCFGWKFWGVWGIFGWTISTHFGTVSSLSMFFIIQSLFLQKSKPLYPTPKYLFGSGIWIWAAKNLRFSLRVSVVRAFDHQIGTYVVIDRKSLCKYVRTYVNSRMNGTWMFQKHF